MDVGAGRARTMYAKEFQEKVVRIEADSELILDVRPFGDRQGEAMDSYLRDLGMAVQMNKVRPTKPIVLVCDSKTVFSSTTNMWLANMQSRGVAIEIQQEAVAAESDEKIGAPVA